MKLQLGISTLTLVVTTVLFTGCARSPQVKEAKALERGKAFLSHRDYSRAVLEFQNAVQAAPKDAEPYYQLALAQLGTGDLKKGYQLLKKAIELNPNHVGAKSNLAELLASSGNTSSIPEAQKAANEVLALSPDNPEALNALALSQLRQGNQQSAEEYLDRALGKFPQDLRIAVLLAKVKITSGDPKGAEQVLKDAALHSPGSADALVALGNFYAASGRSAEAAQVLDSALKINPQYGLALFSLAEVQDRLGQKTEAEETLHRLAGTQDPQYEQWYGMYLFQVGKRDAALKEFERLQQKNPKDRAARSRLVEAYLVVNRATDAQRVVDAALKKNPKDSDALIERASFYLFERKYSEAQTDLNQALGFKPDSSEAHVLLARLHRIRGFVLGERQELTDALKIDPSLLDARLALAENLRPQSPKLALDTLDQAPKNQARRLPLIALRNLCLIALGRDADVRKVIDQIPAAGRTPEILLQDGFLKLKGRQFDTARASFAEALQRNPNDAGIVDVLAKTYLAQGQFDKGLALVRAQAAKYPKSAPSQQLLGIWLQNNRQFAEARTAYAAAKSADPSYDDADLALGLLSMREQKLDEASKLFSGVLERKPFNTRARAFLALANEMTGAYPSAIENYRELVAQEPDNPLFLNGLAWDLAEHAQKPDEALALAEKAKGLAPNDPRVADTLGWIYYQKGIYKSAISQLESASSPAGRLAGEDLDRVKYHLAMAYFKAGDAPRGQAVLTATLRSAPNLPEAKLAAQIRDQVRDVH